ncbi:MAG TPA: LuxR C-terminal-related transcriptional regulator [Streptosporangiaceae bacterium]|nr:LuxR C-terminal-related transcriptional regulator [Streptosporangiaceae bacterium]
MINSIDVAVVWDDPEHPELFEGLRAYAARVPDLDVRETGAAALLRMAEPRPDVVLVEVAPREGGPGTAADVRALCRAGYRVLALCRSSDPYLSASLLGTGACLLPGRKQTIAAIVAAIRASAPRNGAAGSTGDTRPQLSRRERSVLLAYASGMTLDAVAEQVGIRPSTAKTYLERVKAKYLEIGRPAYTKLELVQRAREESASSGGY